MDEAFYGGSASSSPPFCASRTSSSLPPPSPAEKLRFSSPAEMAEAMSPGSVIVDIAAERGGNCELTAPAKLSSTRRHHSGPRQSALARPYHASQMYATNIVNFLKHTGEKDGA